MNRLGADLYFVGAIASAFGLLSYLMYRLMWVRYLQLGEEQTKHDMGLIFLLLVLIIMLFQNWTMVK